MNPNNGKDTVYVDVDDEITSIIEKVSSSKQKIVALVLPKRASVLQSSVNMKLLKRSADNANKNVVLVTTEAALMPLAGAAGLYVAKTPTSKPEVPAGSLAIHDGNVVGAEEALDLDDEPEAEYTADNAGDKPVGELAKAGGAAAVLGAAPDAIETVQLDDEDDIAPTGKVAAGASAAAVAGKKGAKSPKDPKIPNFSRFQKQLALGALALVVLLIGLYFAVAILPRAHITINTDATDYNSNLNATLDSGASEVLIAKNTIPATIAQQQKTNSEQVAATGQQNNGVKATGSVTMSAGSCSANVPADVPAGTGVSAGGNNYITQNSVSFTPTVSKGKCTYQGTNAVSITAQKAGASYNASAGTSFSVNSRSDISASGSASGGTDSIIKVVSQSDVDSATAKLTQQDTSAVKTTLTQQLRTQNLYPVTATFSAGTPNTTTSTPVGQPADAVTVTQAVTYTMYGTKRDYMDQLIENDIKQQIDPATQAILSDGLDKADIKLTSNTDTTALVALQTTATVGPKLDVTALKNQVAGKKTGYVKSLIGNQPGVTNVTVKLSPFWVGSVPKSTEKITITVGKTASAGNTTNGSGQ